MILAGQVNYDNDAPAGGIATVWLPTGTLGAGPHTALVLREAKLGPVGPTFRGVRFDQGGALSLGERTMLSYGGEYVLVGLAAAASSKSQVFMTTTGTWRSSERAATSPLRTIFRIFSPQVLLTTGDLRVAGERASHFAKSSTATWN